MMVEAYYPHPPLSFSKKVLIFVSIGKRRAGFWFHQMMIIQ